MVSAVSNESHATPSYRALGVVKDLGNPPDESAESEFDGRGLGRKNFACRGLRLEPRGEDSAVNTTQAPHVNSHVNPPSHVRSHVHVTCERTCGRVNPLHMCVHMCMSHVSAHVGM